MGFAHTITNGQTPDTAYPYLAEVIRPNIITFFSSVQQQDTCPKLAAVVFISEFREAPESNEDALLSIVARQPVATAIHMFVLLTLGQTTKYLHFTPSLLQVRHIERLQWWSI